MIAPRATIASELTMNDEAQYTVAYTDDLPNSPSLPLPPSLVVLKVSDSRLSYRVVPGSEYHRD